ncbi:hypothetical protein ACLOJK_041810 [Asimina triloba]
MRGSKTLFKEAAAGISTTLSDLIVCPLSKQPLRLFSPTSYTDRYTPPPPIFLQRNPPLISYFFLCRLCRESNTLISDALGVSYPIVDGIPCLVPMEGKVLDADDETAKRGTVAESAGFSNESSRDAAK